MSASPLFKVYRDDGEYVASCKYAEDAAALAGMSTGSQVRAGHAKKHTLFTEGEEDVNACDSWDGAAEIIHRRLRELREREKEGGMP